MLFFFAIAIHTLRYHCMIVSLLTKRALLIIRGLKKKITKFHHMKTTKQRLQELAGLLKEGSVDRDAIAHFVWRQDAFMDKSEDEIDGVIDELEKEYNASKGNYSNVQDYIKELEQSGGLDGLINEQTLMLKSNIDQKWKTADDMAGDMQQWLTSIYSRGYTPSQGPAIYDKLMNVLQNIVDNFDPEDEM